MQVAKAMTSLGKYKFNESLHCSPSQSSYQDKDKGHIWYFCAHKIAVHACNKNYRLFTCVITTKISLTGSKKFLLRNKKKIDTPVI